MAVKVIIILLISAICVASEEPSYTIGVILYKDSTNLLQSAVELSAESFNFNVSIKEVSKRGNILEVKEHVCSLAQEGVIGVIDGTAGRSSEHIQALTDMLEIPHVMIHQNDLINKNWSVINLFPSSDSFNKILEAIIIQKDWNNFTLLYVKGNSLHQMTKLMKMGNETDRPTVAVRELAGDDYRDVLTNAKHHGYTSFVVACPSEYLEMVLLHAQQVGLMAEEHSYIVVSPDLFTLDLERYRYGGVNMTGFRIVDLKQQQLWTFTDMYNKKALKSLRPEELKTSVLLMHDAVKLFSVAVEKFAVIPQSLSCENYDTWEHGSTLLNFMKTNNVDGLTNTLNFDGVGQRVDVAFEILELTTAGNQKIGNFDKKGLVLNRPFLASSDIGAESAMANKTFIILISDTPPYGYKKESVVKLEGNDRYEGFTIDLIEKLSEILGFNYIFELETDYGKFNNVTGKSTGMIQKLREEKAHFAICDFTMNSERKSALDFSMPFMTLGISIMYKEPRKQPPEMFSFMAVFSKEVWYYMMLIQLGLGVVMIFVGRISHREWQNIVPCIEQPEELTNQFSFANSIWLIIGSVMQQGSEIAPIAMAPRMITSIWWFFTMVMVASYTGTLVAFLTVENNFFPFSNAKELAALKTIPYGAKGNGATITFFKNSADEIFKDMYKNMVDNKWLVESNDEGVNRAETTNYAFFAESTSIEYYEERHCDLKMVGGLLDSKSYGIGMKKDSIYKKYIDQALLHLKEKGIIQKLKNLWWNENRGGGKCEVISNKDPKQLGLKNMIGSFVVLGVGCVIGLLISIGDMLWGVFKKSVKYNTTFKYELVEELKFAIKFEGDIKPVKKRSKSSMSESAEALAEAEGKDEVLSLPSIRSGRSSETNKTHHSHSSKHSRHSPSDLTIAFARRREYT